MSSASISQYSLKLKSVFCTLLSQERKVQLYCKTIPTNGTM